MTRDTDLATLLTGYPVRIELPVTWGSMDAFGHVNNTVYFRYFESARIAHFEQVGFSEVMQQKRVGPILASTHCRFRLPLTYPDHVVVASKIIDIAEDRFTMLYRVVSRRHRKLAAEGEGKIVCYDYNLAQKTSLPKGVVEAIRRLQA